MLEPDPGEHPLLLPEELEELHEGRMPLAGDVLLLDSGTLHGAASRFAQLLGRFSHVGICVGSDLYMDAVAGEGVTVRRIADLPDPAKGYRLERCSIARNHALVLSSPKVWTMALEYFELPYHLRSVFVRDDGQAEKRQAVICSRLAAMLLRDIGFGLATRIQRTYPSHLDRLCKPPQWRRFPLLDYDLFSAPDTVAAQRTYDRDYWMDLVRPLHLTNMSTRAILRLLKTPDAAAA